MVANWRGGRDGEKREKTGASVSSWTIIISIVSQLCY